MTRKVRITAISTLGIIVLIFVFALAFQEPVSDKGDWNQIAFRKRPYLVRQTPESTTINWEFNSKEKARFLLIKGTKESVPGFSQKNVFQKIGSVLFPPYDSIPITEVPRVYPDKTHKGGPGFLMQAVCHNLESGGQYSYQIRIGEKATPWATFSVPDPNREDLCFIAYGDSRTLGHDVHKQEIDLMLTESPEFVINTGDLIGNSKEWSQWDTRHFGPASELLSRVPMYTSRGGGHDSGISYHYYQDLNPEKTYYSFDYGNVHVLVLDINYDTKKSVLEGQFDWLKNDLENSHAEWKIAVFHEPPFSGSNHHGSRLDLREWLLPVLTSGGVDLVFNGHTHNYQRTKPIYVDGNPEHAIVYVVTGSANADSVILPFLEVVANTPHFLICKTKGKIMTLDCVDHEGNSVDKFILDKSQGFLPDGISLEEIDRAMGMTPHHPANEKIYGPRWVLKEGKKRYSETHRIIDSMFLNLNRLQEINLIEKELTHKPIYYATAVYNFRQLTTLLKARAENIPEKVRSNCDEILKKCQELEELAKEDVRDTSRLDNVTEGLANKIVDIAKAE